MAEVVVTQPDPDAYRRLRLEQLAMDLSDAVAVFCWWCRKKGVNTAVRHGHKCERCGNG